MHKLLAGGAFAVFVASCGAQASAPPTASPTPTVSASPSPSPEPTQDLKSAYADAVCTDVVNAVPALGAQMGPVLDAAYAQDASKLAREGAKLKLMIADMKDALDRAPDYPPARRFESRLTASIDLFVQGVEASQEGAATSDEQKLLEATGLFQAASDAFQESKSEYQSLSFCG
jgi:hypothetical protein